MAIQEPDYVWMDGKYISWKDANVPILTHAMHYGTAVFEGFKKHFKVETYDLHKKSTCSSLSELTHKSDYIFICLPTPMEPTGKCHVGILDSVIEEINNLNSYDYF